MKRPSNYERAAWFHRRGTTVAQQVADQHITLFGALRAIYRWLKNPCK